MIPFAIFLGLFAPLPFYFIHKLSPKGSILAKFMAYLNVPIIALYIGFLPFSVNGQYVAHWFGVSIVSDQMLFQVVVMSCYWLGIPMVGTNSKARMVQKGISPIVILGSCS